VTYVYMALPQSKSRKAPAKPSQEHNGTTTPDQKTGNSGRLGDSLFFGLSWAGGATILAVLAFVAAFLVIQSLPAILPEAFGIGAQETSSFWSYVCPLNVGTVVA